MGRVSGSRVGRLPVALPVVRVPLLVWLLAGCGRWLGGVVAAAFRHPAFLTVVVTGSAAGFVLWSGNTVLVASTLAGSLSALGLWRVLHPGSFARCVVWPVRSARRRGAVYLRRWEPTLATVGLTVQLDGVRYVPRLVRVRSTATVDLVTVEFLTGQVAEDYAAVADRLAQTFGARECRVHADAKWRNRLVLWFLIRDPLAAPVPPFPPADQPALAGLPVAVGEDGQVYRMRLLGTHLLLVGATSAGKSSVVWAILHALAAGIRSGLVSVWVIDPKGGMELAAGRRLFARFCHGDTAGDDGSHEIGFAEVLEEAVHVMRDRQAKLRGVSRLHEPTPTDPLIVVVVDELASLTSYVTDRDAKRRIAAALSMLLSQGRAVGVTVVAALQDPRKEVLPARDLFPTRIGLRMTEREQVDMVLGSGARLRGARCDQIPESLPGVGYVGLDGVAGPARVRFAHLSDADIAVMVERYDPLTAAWDAGDKRTAHHDDDPVAVLDGGKPDAA
jgi:S-DNA-T family DNA segregation ATPase FtsK/SpoIIIE